MNKVCHEVLDLPYPIQLIQETKFRFAVVYGKQVTLGLTYHEAAKEYGSAIMHALACADRIQN